MIEKEKAALDPPTGEIEEQQQNCIYSISETNQNVNDKIEMVSEIQKKIRRAADPYYLPTFSVNELYESVYDDKPPIVDGLLYHGAYLFVGAPKLGKSFLMMQLAYHVSMGIQLWGYEVQQGTVLYLALEDDRKRLQKRLYRMFGVICSYNLLFAATANKLGQGLTEQLESFISDYEDTNLIIIDTLQKVRNVENEGYSYALDYETVAQLKSFADKHEICILIVHHTRKQKAEDSFEMISGTNGLLGAVDGAFIMSKESRTSNKAILEVVGRDQQEQKISLIRNSETLSWEFESAETELWKEPPDPLLDAISALITSENPEWSSTPTELHERLCLEIPSNSITKRLNVNAARLKNEYGIGYRSSRTHDGRRIELWLLQGS